MIVAELLLSEAQDPRSIRGTYRVIQEAECVSSLFSHFVLCEKLCLVFILLRGPRGPPVRDPNRVRGRYVISRSTDVADYSGEDL